MKISKQAERRERNLRDLMKKGKRPIVIVVDEAHDLHHKTLTGLKRLMEVVADAGVLLSVLMVGHPRLRNDLRRPQMEEIGYRTTIFDYEGLGAARRDYMAWLLSACAAEGVKVSELLEEAAIDDLIAERLRTPLQIDAPDSCVSASEPNLSPPKLSNRCCRALIDDLEPTLTRNGYDEAALVTQLNARPSDVRAFLGGTLDPEHSLELTEKLRQAGVPI